MFRVLSGLEEVDDQIFELADLFGIDPASPFGAPHSLIALDLLPQSVGRLYSTLRDARNLIAHSNTIPNESETAAASGRFLTLKKRVRPSKRQRYWRAKAKNRRAIACRLDSSAIQVQKYWRCLIYYKRG